MTYIQEIAKIVKERCHISDDKLANIYALLCVTTGINTTNENVHDAWVLWIQETKLDHHKSAIPYNQLSKTVQDLDTPFRDAIREISAEIKA